MLSTPASANHGTNITVRSTGNNPSYYRIRINDTSLREGSKADSGDDIISYDNTSRVDGSVYSGEDTFHMSSSAEVVVVTVSGGSAEINLENNMGSANQEHYARFEGVNGSQKMYYDFTFTDNVRRGPRADDGDDNRDDYFVSDINPGGVDDYYVEGQLGILEMRPRGGKIRLEVSI